MERLVYMSSISLFLAHLFALPFVSFPYIWLIADNEKRETAKVFS